MSDNLMAFIKVLRSFVARSTIALWRKRSGSFHTEQSGGSEIINNSRKFAPYFARNSRHRRLREIHAIICGKSCRTDLTNPAKHTSHFSGYTKAHMHKKESDGNYYREGGNDFVFATDEVGGNDSVCKDSLASSSEQGRFLPQPTHYDLVTVRAK